jgi:hypothetical protein
VHLGCYKGDSCFEFGELISDRKGPFPASTMILADFYVEATSTLVQEGQVWVGLAHPNVAAFFGIFYDPCSPGTPCFVTPYYPDGDVSVYLSKHPKADRLQLVSQSVTGFPFPAPLPCHSGMPSRRRDRLSPQQPGPRHTRSHQIGWSLSRLAPDVPLLMWLRVTF